MDYRAPASEQKFKVGSGGVLVHLIAVLGIVCKQDYPLIEK